MSALDIYKGQRLLCSWRVMQSMGDPDASVGGPDDGFAPPPPPSNSDYRHARWRRPVRALQLRSADRGTRNESIPRSSAYTAIDSRRVVIVGVCASGKSTLREYLRAKGYIVHICAQEHSGVPGLWERLEPDVLIYLDASLGAIRGRGRSRWRQANLDTERERLAHARQYCDLYVYTDGLSPQDVAARALTFLNNSK